MLEFLYTRRKISKLYATRNYLLFPLDESFLAGRDPAFEAKCWEAVGQVRAETVAHVIMLGLSLQEELSEFGPAAATTPKKEDPEVPEKKRRAPNRKRTHTCKICKVTSEMTKDEIDRHREEHDLEGRYTCNFCGKSFFYWQTRKVHRWTCKDNPDKDGEKKGKKGPKSPKGTKKCGA